MMFQKAKREQRKLRLALCGPTGSGKTYSALRVARGLGGKVAVIDTERHSSSLYADEFDFDVADLPSGNPEDYCRFLEGAARAGYDVVVIDSFSHAWAGEEGILAQKDKAAKRQKGGNDFAAWRNVTPMHDKLVRTVLDYPGHVIVTLRSKMAYELVEERGKKVPKKIGLQPIQRDGVEYEFDVVVDIGQEHEGVVTKTRAKFLDGKVLEPVTERLGEELRTWLTQGAESSDNGTQTQPPANVVDHPAVRQTTEALGGEVSGARAPRTETPIQIEDWADTAHRMLADLRAQLNESTIEGFVFDGSPPASLDRFFSPAEIQARGREDGRRLVAVMREAVAVQAGGAA